MLAPLSAAVAICLLVAGLTTLVLAGLFALVIWACAGIALAVFAAGRSAAARRREDMAHVEADGGLLPAGASTSRPGPPTAARAARSCIATSGLGGWACSPAAATCGTLLPTMALRAAWRLEAVCQRCGEPLPAGSGAVRDVRIPIFGDTSAGKTRFLYAALNSLIDITSRAGIPLGFPDQDSENQAELGLDRHPVRTGHRQDLARRCRPR